MLSMPAMYGEQRRRHLLGLHRTRRTHRRCQKTQSRTWHTAEEPCKNINVYKQSNECIKRAKQDETVKLDQLVKRAIVGENFKLDQ